MNTTTDIPALRTRTRRDRLTIAAGVSLLVVCVLHTLAFSVHPYWADWLAGPLRTTEATLDEAAQFWGLPGGFVLPGALLAVLLIRRGREGGRAPAAFGPVLGLWALGCVWILGPSGFLFLLVPATLLVFASVRGARSER
jgi:predicted membrane protein